MNDEAGLVMGESKVAVRKTDFFDFPDKKNLKKHHLIREDPF